MNLASLTFLWPLPINNLNYFIHEQVTLFLFNIAFGFIPLLETDIYMYNGKPNHYK